MMHTLHYYTLYCRYREGRYPDNMEKLCIINTSAIVCNATFCFEHDTNYTTFTLDPPGMTLQPGQSKVGHHLAATSLQDIHTTGAHCMGLS